MISLIKIETDIQSLNEVLNQTGNPTVAVQILNGTYQDPEICTGDRASVPDKEGNIKQFIFVSYDKWTDEVSYTYKGSWVSKMSRVSWNNLELWAALTWDGDETDKIVY